VVLEILACCYHYFSSYFFFPFRSFLQVQTRKMTCFSKMIRNLETNYNILRDIDKRKLCMKLNRAMTTRKHSKFCKMKLYHVESFFFKNCIISKNIWNLGIIPQKLRGISERKPSRRCYWAESTIRKLKKVRPKCSPSPEHEKVQVFRRISLISK